MYLRRNFHKVCSCKNQDSLRVFDSNVEEFHFNKCGFIQSDFATLKERENELDMFRALSRMQQMEEDSSTSFESSGKTLDEFLAEVRPRWCQSPAEIARFEEFLANNAIDFYKKLQRDEDARKAVEASQGVKVPVESSGSSES